MQIAIFPILLLIRILIANTVIFFISEQKCWESVVRFSCVCLCVSDRYCYATTPKEEIKKHGREKHFFTVVLHNILFPSQMWEMCKCVFHCEFQQFHKSEQHRTGRLFLSFDAKKNCETKRFEIYHYRLIEPIKQVFEKAREKEKEIRSGKSYLDYLINRNENLNKIVILRDFVIINNSSTYREHKLYFVE